MTRQGLSLESIHALLAATPFEIERVRTELEAGNGGYRIVHASSGLEIGVYVLCVPEPDRQERQDGDKVYIVLEGRGVVYVEGRPVPLERGQALFVPAGARHQFTGYEQLSVLVVRVLPRASGRRFEETSDIGAMWHAIPRQ